MKMGLYYVQQVGPNVVMLQPIGGPVDPGYGVGGGLRPDQGLPWQPGHPDQGLPGGGHVGNRPPGSFPGRPDNSLPGSPGHPDNRPPSGPPPQVSPGEVLVMIRDQAGVWHYAAIQPGSPPPRPLPPIAGGGHPDQGLPGSPGHPSTGPVPPGGSPPHVSGQPVPPPPGGTVSPPIAPTPAPKR